MKAKVIIVTFLMAISFGTFAGAQDLTSSVTPLEFTSVVGATSQVDISAGTTSSNPYPNQDELLARAIDFLLATINPDTFSIDYFWLLDDGSLVVSFNLTYGGIWVIVDKTLGYTHFDVFNAHELESIVFDIRQNIAGHMNVGIEQVHINYIMSASPFPMPPISYSYPSLARVGNFDIYTEWSPDLYQDGSFFPKKLELRNVTNTVTGVDANTYILEVLNMDLNIIDMGYGFADWVFTEDQILRLSVRLLDGSTIDVNMSTTGDIWIHDHLEDEILMIRNEVAMLLHTRIEGTYLSGLTKDPSNIYTLNIDGWAYLGPYGDSKLTFTFSYDPANGESKLTRIATVWSYIDTHGNSHNFILTFSYDLTTYEIKLTGITNEVGIEIVGQAMKYYSANFFYPAGYFVYDSFRVEGDAVVLLFVKKYELGDHGWAYIEMKADINTGVIRESTEVYDHQLYYATITRLHDENGTLRVKEEVVDNWMNYYPVEIDEYYFYIRVLSHSESLSEYDENGILRYYRSEGSVTDFPSRSHVLERWSGFTTFYGNGHIQRSHGEYLIYNYQDGSIRYRDVRDEEYREDGGLIKELRVFESYDSSGRLINKVVYDSYYSYDSGGNIKSYVATTNTYDKDGVLVEKMYVGQFYYSDGKPSRHIDSVSKYENNKLVDNVTETYLYDTNGQITGRYRSHAHYIYQDGVLKENKMVTLSYDKDGNLLSSWTSTTTYENGVAVKVAIEYLKYENGVLKSKVNTESTYKTGRLQLFVTATLTYNSSGILIQQRYEARSYGSDGNILRRIISISTYENNKLVDNIGESYYYGSNGEIISHYLSHTHYTYQNGVLKEYKINTATYDKTGTLLSSSTSTGIYENGIVVKWTIEYLKYENNKIVSSNTYTYYYNKNGKLSYYNKSTVTYGESGAVIERKNEARSYNQYGTLYWHSVTTLRYDSRGNVIETFGESKGYDQQGKLTSSWSFNTVLTYDANNIMRLQYTESFGYDGQGRPTYSYTGLYKFNEAGRVYDVSGSQLTYKNGVLAEERSWQYSYDVSTSRIAGATIRVVKYDNDGKMVSDCTTISRYNANGVLTYRYITTKTYSSDGRILDESTRAATSINSFGIVTAERVIGSKPIYGYFTYNNQVVYYQIGTEKYFIDSFYNDSGILTNRRISVQECDVSGKVVEDYVKYTTQVDANGVIREEKILNGKKYGWAGGTWQRLISYTITFQYDAAGKLISEAGNKYNSAGVKIEEYTRTVSNVFGSVTEVVHKNIYNDLGQMIDEYTVTFERLHYSDGDILRQRIEGTKYDMLGNVIENYNSGVSEWDAYGNAIQEFAQGIRFDADGHVIDMYNITRSYVAGSSGKDRMPSPYPNLPQGILSAQVIEGKQVYADTGYVKEWYKITATHIGCDGTIYEERAEGEIFGQDGSSYGTYTILTNYDPDGKITNKSGSITLYNAASQERIFTIRYDISAGAVTYTHVYDIAGNEVLDLGGSGLIAPFDIAKRYYGPGSPLDPKEALPKTAVQDDTSVADRLDLQNAAQDQGNMPSGVTITGSLAGNPLDTGYSQLQ